MMGLGDRGEERRLLSRGPTAAKKSIVGMFEWLVEVVVRLNVKRKEMSIVGD